MTDLERENPIQFRVVQCRFLLGMTVTEAAAALKISTRTVEREWQNVKACLSEKIHPASE